LLLPLLAQVELSMTDASRKNFSEYIRAMSVSEMIGVVADVKELFDQHQSMVLSPHYIQPSLVQS
jgi:hypothetical protein